jgi:hypothetical protein
MPAANQAAAATAAVKAKHVTELGRFSLRLVDHPCLVVCTRRDCAHQLPLVPTLKEVMAHLKKAHQLSLVESAQKRLEEVLAALALDHPSVVDLDGDLLPVPAVKELAIVNEGYRCNYCTYAVKARSAIHAHLRSHEVEEGKPSFTHPVALQIIHESGQHKRYLHVRDRELDPTPASAILNPAVLIGAMNGDIKAKVDAFLKQDQECLREADLVRPGVQPTVFSGNIGPWAKQLKWHSYWASKPIVAIGALGPDPRKWPGAHADFVCWLLAMGRQASLTWMTAFVSAGRQVQQAFREHGPDASHPYDLSPQTVKKRADLWAFLLALFAHVLFEGDTLKY